jgi:CTP:phosphocholine cytidylyltransferase-like protein
MINDILNKESAMNQQAIKNRYWNEVLKNNITNLQIIPDQQELSNNQIIYFSNLQNPESFETDAQYIDITNYTVLEDNKQI